MFPYKEGKERLRPLRCIPKAKMMCAVNNVSCVLQKIDIRHLAELNNTMYAATNYFSEFFWSLCGRGG